MNKLIIFKNMSKHLPTFGSRGFRVIMGAGKSGKNPKSV